ncbi:phospholipid-translocating P-type ATPase [Neocallimastix californiae]|uniref:Phospholipid-transporting ATPase n=1 Tax=Neocallimastix californiae TaxID=1754190 RepID=A0A1Y2F3B3_9FUNG|nr:phospholipid-translocating P-type ATPase [Neocallimastix californiae]|eukprot:ORY78333.1 phospholipid-translocating P-type ATPase [Neocallimastix californiae]
MVDKFGAQLFSYPKNKIKTSKYTLINFLPKNLYEQCRRVANLFFIFLIIFQFIPVFQEMDPIWAIIPLAGVMLVTALKDGYEDLKRHQMDTELNNSITYIPENWDNLNYPSVNLSWKNYIFSTIYWYFRKHYQPKVRRMKRYKQSKPSALNIASIIGKESIPLDNGTNEGWRKTLWKYVRVGDIICIRNNEMIPADMIVLSTCEKDNICYIETKSLDGETSLKIRKGPEETAYISSVDEAKQFKGFIDAGKPTPELQRFTGVLTIPAKEPQSQKNNGEEIIYPEGEKSIPLNVNNILLRGSILRNTDWVIGVVIYTGCDTKVILGSGKTPSKRSKIEKIMNPQVVFNFVILFALSIITSIVHYFVFNNWQERNVPWINYNNSSLKSMVYALGNAVILLQTIIPISLYVTIEIIKMIHTFWISGDEDMYYEPHDEACLVKTWTISDDLGQIEYIFSDKTGTLTQNKMEFRRCSINGKVYGIKGTDVSLQGKDIEVVHAKEVEIETKMREQMKKVYNNPYLNTKMGLPFIDDTLFEDLERNNDQSERIKQFFTHIAICHTVLSPKSKDPSNFVYGAESPDELSLVSTAKDLGFIFTGRDTNQIYLNIQGEEMVYQILNIIEFNSTRKRMSIIVKDTRNDDIILFCKGADNIIYERLMEKDDISKVTLNHLEDFANEGLRTLCIAYRNISQEEYHIWNEQYIEASKAMTDREEKMSKVAEIIEKDFTLIGATAIEDRLQDGVPDCIDTLLAAGIKVWVLTGDKFETAVNIGYACNLLKKNMRLLMIRSSDNPKEIEEQLLTAMNQILKEGSFGMIIEGLALRSTFDNEKYKSIFLNIGIKCDAVICCRVAPKQKAEVVKLIKSNLKAMCLSIGDGANDVSMIQEANVGVGIAGEEGMQAAMSSDYVIGQFRFLKKLLLVHGRWSYLRIANCVLNFFFKNMVWTFIMFYFQIVNGFSATMIFDYPLWMYYNLIFTVLPVCVIGILDQDVKAKTALKIPQIYASTKEKQTLFTGKRFLLFVLNAVYLSIISFIIPFCMTLKGALPIGYDDDKKLIGNIIACYGIVVANITALMYMHSWDILGTTIIVIEIISFFLYIPVAKGFDSETPDLYCLFKLPSFWFGLLIAVMLCVLPYIIIRFAKSLFCPSDLIIVKEMEHFNINYPPVENSVMIENHNEPTVGLTNISRKSSNSNDRDIIPLKKAKSAPAFSNRYALYKGMSIFDTKTKAEFSNTGFAFSYSEFSPQEKEDDDDDDDENEDEKIPKHVIPEAERRKRQLFNRHSMFILNQKN